MTDQRSVHDRSGVSTPSRRSVLRTGAIATVGSALGLSTAASAQDGDGGQATDSRQALMLGEQWRGGTVFRVVSPALGDAPQVTNQELVQNRTVQVVEYFNTEEEVYLFLSEGTEPLQQGQMYALADGFSQPDTGDGPLVANYVQVQFRPLDPDEFPFDLDEDADLEFLDGGGEAAVRPRNFFSGALFRVTSGPQGWVPEDVADSGFFTDYQTHHARYLSTGDTFLFFPQEDAETSQDQLYVMRDEFELFDPEGNLVASEFDPVDEESVPVDDEFL